MVSGWGLWASGRCLGVCRCHIHGRELNKCGNIKLLLLFSSALQCSKMPISGGVWIVSGGVWMGSKGVWEMSGGV